MTDMANAEKIIRIANDALVVDTGTDWTAVIALIFSVCSTILILWWQNYLRKKDKEEQAQIRESDKSEEQIKIKQENKIKQWNALYPYRVKFYTEFYDNLFQLVNCTIKRTATSFETQQLHFKLANIVSFRNLFNKQTEESKVLFNKHIQHQVRQVYLLLDRFVADCRNRGFDENADIPIGNDYDDRQSLSIMYLIAQIKQLKLDETLRVDFQKILTLKEMNDE